jgi:hypothetical protein
VHLAEPTEDTEFWHGWQDVDPADAAKVFFGHRVHAPLPIDDLKVPGGHVVHMPFDKKYPGKHSQNEDPGFAVENAGHVVQLVRVVVEIVSPGHLLHATFPKEGLNEPGIHGLQLKLS